MHKDFTEYFQFLYTNIQMLRLEDFKISESQLSLILVSNLVWWLIYRYIHFFININHKTKREIYDTKTRIVSIIHALYVLGLSFFDFFFNQNDKCGQANNPLQNFVLCTSMGYFLYDTIACIIFNVSDIQMVMHHFSVMFGYYS